MRSLFNRLVSDALPEDAGRRPSTTELRAEVSADLEALLLRLLAE